MRSNLTTTTTPNVKNTYLYFKVSQNAPLDFKAETCFMREER